MGFIFFREVPLETTKTFLLFFCCVRLTRIWIVGSTEWKVRNLKRITSLRRSFWTIWVVGIPMVFCTKCVRRYSRRDYLGLPYPKRLVSIGGTHETTQYIPIAQIKQSDIKTKTQAITSQLISLSSLLRLLRGPLLFLIAFVSWPEINTNILHIVVYFYKFFA